MHFSIALLLLFQSIVSATNFTVSTYAPVSTTATGPPVPTPPAYRLQSLGDGAYMVTDGLYQSLFFVTGESVIAVDAPPTIGENIVRAIRSVTPNPISHVVYSHHHADHIGGAYLLGSPMNVTFVAHQLTAGELALVPNAGDRPAPSITFENFYTLNVGNQTLQLDYRGPNHDPGNIFIYAPVQKILMLVDIVYPGWAPFALLGESQSIPGYVRAHDLILTYDFDYYIGGHLNRPGTRQDVIVAQEYVLDLFNTAVLAINMSAETNSPISVASVIGPAVNAVDPNNSWAFFNTYIDVLAGYVADELSTRWSDRLFGLDVYGQSLATTMLESVRIDWGILGPFGVTNA